MNPNNNDYSQSSNSDSNNQPAVGFSRDSFFNLPPQTPQPDVPPGQSQSSENYQQSPQQGAAFSRDSFFNAAPPQNPQPDVASTQYPPQNYSPQNYVPPQPPPYQPPAYGVPDMRSLPPTAPTPPGQSSGGSNKILLTAAVVISLSAIGLLVTSQFKKNNETPIPLISSPNNDTVKPTSPVVTEQESTANQLANARREATSSGNLEKAIQMAQGIPTSSSVYIEAQQQIQSWKSDFEKHNNVLADIRQAYNAGQWQVVVDLSYNQIPRNQYWDSNSELTSMAVNAKQKLQSSRKEMYFCTCGGIDLGASTTNFHLKNGPELGYAGCTVTCLPESKALFFCQAKEGRFVAKTYSDFNLTGTNANSNSGAAWQCAAKS
ncbi:MAG: hypothetical protein ACK5QS_11515 [Pseudanabaenaceae cyanobacterium]